MELATTYTKTVSVLGVEVLALRDLCVICHALAFKLDDLHARKELLARITVLENVSNQLQR